MHSSLLPRIACLLSLHEPFWFLFFVSVDNFSVSPLSVSLDSIF